MDYGLIDQCCSFCSAQWSFYSLLASCNQFQPRSAPALSSSFRTTNEVLSWALLCSVLCWYRSTSARRNTLCTAFPLQQQQHPNGSQHINETKMSIVNHSFSEFIFTSAFFSLADIWKQLCQAWVWNESWVIYFSFSHLSRSPFDHRQEFCSLCLSPFLFDVCGLENHVRLKWSLSNLSPSLPPRTWILLLFVCAKLCGCERSCLLQ